MVTASSAELPVLPRGLVGAIRQLMPRDEFFAGLYIVGCVNGLAGGIIEIAQTGDWANWTQGGRSISVIVLFACVAGIALLLRDKGDQIKSADLALGVVFLVLVAVPVSVMSWVAVTGLSLYILLFTNASSSRKRGAWILLALTVPMLWSRMLFAFFAKFFLELDASLVASLLGTQHNGNLVRFADGSGYLMILPACSSLSNVSLAFLCWATISQSVEHQWSRTDIWWCLLACASVAAVNVARISLEGLSRGYYQAIHNQWGDTVINVIVLVLTIGFSVLGVRRELFSRA